MLKEYRRWSETKTTVTRQITYYETNFLGSFVNALITEREGELPKVKPCKIKVISPETTQFDILFKFCQEISQKIGKFKLEISKYEWLIEIDCEKECVEKTVEKYINSLQLCEG